MTTATQIEERRGYDGPAWLERGFRPFFFFAGVWAMVSVLVWLGFLSGILQADSAVDLMAWHSHELIFGYTGSALMGFALTAIPNWTGRLPVRGNRLAMLALFWLVARLASLVSLGNIGIYPFAAAAEVAVLGGFAAIVFREIVAGRNWRNLPVVGMIVLFGLISAWSHAGRLGLVEWEVSGTRAGLALLVLLITLIGGRIVPSFTRSWLNAREVTRLPAPFGALDKVVIAATALALVAWLVLSPSPWLAAIMATMAVLHIIRLARWRSRATFGEPLVAALHVAYLWIPMGFMLIEFSAVGIVAPSAALHGWTIGMVGGMTLAVMTRASLGHSGRELTASRRTTLCFLLIHTAALLRVLDGTLVLEGVDLVLISGVCWLAAFALYVHEYAPIQLKK